MKKHIPNLITLANLLAGLVAIIAALKGDLAFASFLILLGIFFDFFDGFAARLLKVSSELGKQLDSLADVVTSGVAPSIIMYKLLENSQGQTEWFQNFSSTIGSWIPTDDDTFYYFPYIALLFALASAYRLANFNIDTRQSSSFIGLPTPASTLVIAALPLIQLYSTNYFAIALTNDKFVLIGITLLLSILMNIELPLFSLKFKNLSFKDNAVVFIFLLISLALVITLKFIAIPLIIAIYILFSLMININKNLKHS